MMRAPGVGRQALRTGDMIKLTAHMVERGRNPASETLHKRRRVAQDVRTAREKLTSSTGLERTFEHELVRRYAEYHVASTLVVAALATAIAAVSTLWFPPSMVLGWLALAMSALVLSFWLSRDFLRADAATVPFTQWRQRFVLSEMITGLVWAMAVQRLALVPDGTNGFALFVAIIVAAVTSVLSAPIPFAVYAGIAPLAGVAAAVAISLRDMPSLMLAGMICSGLVFFVALADRLYTSAMAIIRSRVEKDTLFVELEEAKANSDEARRRAEEANLAKSRFLATMSHELRTPLNAILGFSEVMCNEVFGPLSNPSYREYSTDIHASGQHLLTLINEILDLSRIEAGRYELAEEATQLGWIADECRHMLSLKARAKNQRVQATIDPALPKLWADERAVRQIVLNILSNAIKFTPQGGEIAIKVGWTASGGQYVSVKDTGPGIPESEIPVVMSSFGRGTLAIKTAEQGSGLGLPIVKGLIDLHGGSFALKSRPREGTEVIVAFPPSRVIDVLPAVEVGNPPASPAKAA